MFRSEILILGREDLRKDMKNVNIIDIEYFCFNFKNRGLFLKEHIVMFVDNDQQTKILKNRWGSVGIINNYNKSNIIKKIKKWMKNLL